MLVIPVPGWIAATNAYVVAPERGAQAIVVDTPPHPEGIVDVIRAHQLAVVGILLTHGHVDHTGGSRHLSAVTGASVYVHPEDDFLTLHPYDQLRAIFGMAPPGDFAPPDRLERLSHGDLLRLAGLELRVVHTPGHTPGHCCFHLEAEEALFSGDQLFAGSVGRTDLPRGSFTELMTSMRDRVMTLPDTTRVLPGHGPETTIRQERLTNPFRGEWSGAG